MDYKEELKEIDKVPEKFNAIYIIPSDEYNGFWGKNGYKSFDFIFEYKREKIGWLHWEGDVINIVCKNEYGIRIDSNINDGFIRLFSNKELEISDLIVSDITISLRGEI